MKPKDCTCTGVCLQIPDGSCQRLNKSMDSGNDKVPQFISSEPKADPKEKSSCRLSREDLENITSWPKFCEEYKMKHGISPIIVNENSKEPNFDGVDEWTNRPYPDLEKKSKELKEQFKKDFGPKEEFIETEIELCPCEISREYGITVMCFACTGKQKYIKRVSFKLALPK